MERNKSTDYIKMTRELVIRLIEWVLSNRFHDSDQDENIKFIDPLFFPFTKEYFGKFGVRRDLEGFPYHKKLGEQNSLLVILYLRPMKSFSSTQKNMTLNAKKSNVSQHKILEKWHISLELTDSYSYDSKALNACYQKVIKTVSSKSVELPAYSYIKSMGENFTKYDHFLEYELQSKDLSNSKLGEFWTSINHSWTDSSTNWSEFKFDIGWGKLKFKVEYVPKSGLSKINEDLTSNYCTVQNEDDYDPMQKTKIMAEYFGGSTKNSNIEGENEDSGEFELIMTSEANQNKPTNENNHYNTEGYKTEPQKSSKINQNFKLPSKLEGLKDIENFDDFELNPDELFKTNDQINHKNLTSDWELDNLRNRCNSDNTACTRAKNILNERKNSGNFVSPFKQFQKQSFEFKNSISPRIMENFSIDEWYFGEEEIRKNIKDINWENVPKDKFNKYLTINPNDLNSSASQVGDDSYFNSPSFLNNNEFKASIDTFQRESRTRINPFSKTFKQRKFTLSFDGGINNGNEDYEHLMKSYSNVQNTAERMIIGDQILDENVEGNNFVISIEDDHFSAKENNETNKDKKEINSKLQNNIDNLTKLADKQTRNSTASSQSKIERSTSKDYEISFINNDYEFELFKHERSDSWNGNMSTRSDFNKFLGFIDNIRKRLDRKPSKNVWIEEKICSSHNFCKNHLQIAENCDFKEKLLNNYKEIMDLNDQIKNTSYKYM